MIDVMKLITSCFLLIFFVQQRTQASKASLVVTDLPSRILFNLQAVGRANRNFVPKINGKPLATNNVSNCTQDLRVLSEALATAQPWALKAFDAWGKLPSGVMQGNLFWFGSVDECRHDLRDSNGTVIEAPFRTHSCIIGDGFSDAVLPVFGICVPQTCSVEQIVDFINQNIIEIPTIQPYLNVTTDNVRCLDPRPYDAKAIITVVFLSVVVFLILLATGIHFAYREHGIVKTEEDVGERSEAVVSRTETSVSRRVVTTSTVTTTVHPNEQTPLMQSTEEVTITRPKGFALLRYCSLVNNISIAMSEHQPRNFAYLNGIRVLSLFWVILGHTFIIAIFYSDNSATIRYWSRQLWFQILPQATFSIDTFFLLSGLLTAFTYFILKSDNERFSLVKFLLNHYIYRYLRYTLFYAVILLVYITLSPYLGGHGPIYPISGTESSNCRRNWWRNLLYINNFYPSSDGCMPVTWFVAVNMQFHWIAPLFLIAASCKWIFALLVATALVLVDIISTAVIVTKYHDDDPSRANGTHNYLDDVYDKPWCRVAPYAIGLVVGHAIYVIYQRSHTLSWESLLPDRNNSRLRRLRQVLSWTFALIVINLCIFGPYGNYIGRPLSRSARIAYLSLSRTGWAVAVSVIILACFNGYGGIANRFLSHRLFGVLGKLTYGAYLWHSLVIFVNYLSREGVTHFTWTSLLINCILNISIAYFLSFLTFLFIELPIIHILKFFFRRSSNEH